jgi:hypothetical protein
MSKKEVVSSTVSADQQIRMLKNSMHELVQQPLFGTVRLDNRMEKYSELISHLRRTRGHEPTE